MAEQMPPQAHAAAMMAQYPPEQQQQQQQQHNHLGDHQIPIQHASSLFLQQQHQVKDDPSMRLSEEERRCALAIKHAVQKEEDIGPVSDMLIAQVALIELRNHPPNNNNDVINRIVAAAVERLLLLQAIKEEYEIKDNFDLTHAMKLLRQGFDQHRGLVLSVDYDYEQDHFVWIYDIAAFYPREITNWRAVMWGLYYTCHAMCPTLAAIRSGVVHLAESSDVNWSNVEANAFQAVWRDMAVPYPIYHRSVVWLNSSMVANMAYAFLKPVLPPDLQHRFTVGSRLEGYGDGERIDSLFKQPTPEVAQELTLFKIRGFLELRFRNEQEFRLE